MGATAGDAQVSRVGPYRLVRRIGSGGMAEVFEAEEEQLGQRVALKRLHANVAERKGAAARFLREGRAVSRVRHPHVVQVFALGEDAGAPYLAMELLDGEDLCALLVREGYLTVHAALDVILPVLAGVSAAHEAGVIHRDLKPSNVFLTRGPGGCAWPKVIDFGISKLLAGDAHSATDSDAVLGTVAYMAPEQARSVRGASFHSDQYSLGVVLYECLTGKRPFEGQGVLETLQSIMTAPVPPPSALEPALPKKLDEAVLRAMDRDPGQRFASLRAFGAALIPFASPAARSTWQAWFEERGALRAEGASLPATEEPTNTSTLAVTRSSALAPPRAERSTLGVVLALSALVASAAVLVPALARRHTAMATVGDTARQGSPSEHAGARASGEPPEVDLAPVASPPPASPAEPAAPSALAAAPEIPTSAARSSGATGPTARPHPARKPAAAPASPSAAETTIRLGENDAPILP